MNENLESAPPKPLGGAERIQQIARQLREGQSPAPVTVRELLGWFDSQRRGSFIVFWIRDCLSKANLTTKPDFEGTYIDGLIEFVLSEEASPEERSLPDPTYRIGKLHSANMPPVSVGPTQLVSEAITIMLARNFSQLPVMAGERDVKGIISWASIGSRLALGKKCEEVRECMDAAHEISADTSLFDAINEIVNNQYVLIRDSTNKISGIVTTSDLSLQFRQLAEPFLLLGEIENHVRWIIGRGRFTKNQLREHCDPNDQERKIDGVFDLAFGEYVRLLENPKWWSQVRLSLDRKIFIGDLDNVRRIRNDVMHFDPDGISEDDLVALRNFTRLLQQLRQMIPDG